MLGLALAWTLWTSTLLAFVIVSAGIIVLRRVSPDIQRPFKTPLVPLVPILAILICGYMMYSLPLDTWLRLLVWMALGATTGFVAAVWTLAGVRRVRTQPARRLSA